MNQENKVFNIKAFDWNNYKVLSRNRKPNRVHFYPYGDVVSAHSLKKENSSRIKVLDGEWDFKWLESPLEVTKEVMNDLKSYGKINVPQNWQYSGYGKFVYTDMWYDFPVDVPYVPVDKNETGLYHKTIEFRECPSNLAIRFEGVESSFHLYVNGEMIGYSQGSRYPSEFEIGHVLTVGQNDIHVVVYQYCDGSYLEAQDMWWLGGIIREVYLIERQHTHFENLILDPDYDMSCGAGLLNTKITLSKDALVACKVYDGQTLVSEIDHVILNGQIKIENILPWTAETPKLYTLLFILKDHSGMILEVIPQKIGFRHIEIINGELLLNGQKILMKGINRHEYSAHTGRAVTYEQTYNEVKLIKQHHMNAIRTSHYPNNPFFYDICNELGVYVIDEADLESHGLEAVNTDTLLCNNSEYEAMYIDRIERLVERDRNYACVIIWSLGNESAYGVNFSAMYDWCKSHEPSRFVHYEGDLLDESVDVTSTMYSDLGKLYEIDCVEPKKPHILCEFGHAMGNGPGSLKEYFDLVENSRRIQGLFIWEFKDHGVYQLGEDGNDRYYFGGEFNEDFHNGNFCMDGMVMANDQITPSLKEYAKVVENIHVVDWCLENKTMRVKNRFEFTDTSNIQVTYQLIEDDVIVNTIQEPLSYIEPKSIKTIAINEEIFDYVSLKQLYLNVIFTLETATNWCDQGFVVGQDRFLIKAHTMKEIVIEEQLKVDEYASYLLISGDAFDVKVSKRNGFIYDLNYQDKTVMSQGPTINFFRAYTDNDIKNMENWPSQHLHAMAMNVYEQSYVINKSHVIITTRGRSGARGLNWGCLSTLTYTISKDGYIKINWNGEFDGKPPKHLPKIGLQMKVDKSLENIVYQGDGPGECYCDSKENAYQGIYRMNYQDLSFNYLYPQENGNRTGVSWATLASKTFGIAFGSDSMDFSVRDVSDEDLNKAKYSVDLHHQDTLIVNCDMINSGLGSQSCGPDRMNHYKAFTKVFEFSLFMKPFGKTINVIDEARNVLAYKIDE